MNKIFLKTKIGEIIKEFTLNDSVSVSSFSGVVEVLTVVMS